VRADLSAVGRIWDLKEEAARRAEDNADRRFVGEEGGGSCGG
jgi:hypothetical protein